MHPTPQPTHLLILVTHDNTVASCEKLLKNSQAVLAG